MNEFKRDIQEEKPKYSIGLNRVGVEDIEKIIRLNKDGNENLFCSNIDIYVDLLPSQKGIHMSRFDETLTHIIDDIIYSEVMTIENLASTIAEEARKSQGANYSEVKIQAKYPLEKQTPVSEKRTQKINNIIGWSVSKEEGNKQLVGVETKGMTVCPCAQEMMKEYVSDRLDNQDFSGKDIEKILETVPMVSHNQKGEGTLMLGTEQPLNADRLARLIENSMSAQIIDLLKRPDEFEIVKKAHFDPKFVEDVVREIVHSTIEEVEELRDSDYIYARQKNYEGIHDYQVFAEKHGTLAEMKKELNISDKETDTYDLDGETTSIRDWLYEIGGF